MSKVPIEMIKELRERTGAGMSDCKKALVEAEADADKAIEFLRKKGLAKAAKKGGRIATEGSIHSYIHSNGRVGVLLEVNCETDFAARNDIFVQFTKDVAMQIAAMSPSYVKSDDVPASAVEKERDIRLEEAKNTGKPEMVIEKIVDGQIKKWLKEICLMDQVFVRDSDGKRSIEQLRTDVVAKLGENIQIRRFERYELGEGLT